MRAVNASLGDDLVAWVGKPRVWKTAEFEKAGVVLDPDPRMQITPGNEGLKEGFSLIIDEAESRHALARLGPAGPILDSATISGFRLLSGLETNFQITETYPDGTDAIEMGVVMSPVLPAVQVEIKLIVGGVVFEDGTVLKKLAAADFDSLGEATVRFLRPKTARTSACHSLIAWQGGQSLGDAR